MTTGDHARRASQNPTEGFIIRHAEIAANAGGRTGDHSTISITESGLRPAQRVAELFSDKPMLIVVSPYLRTVQTAAPLLQRYPDVPVEQWAIEEFNYLGAAACAGTTYSERQGLRDRYWSRYDPSWTDGPGCESFSEFIARLRRFEQALGARAAGQTVVVFTHGLVMQAVASPAPIREHQSWVNERI